MCGPEQSKIKKENQQNNVVQHNKERTYEKPIFTDRLGGSLPRLKAMNSSWFMCCLDVQTNNSAGGEK